MKILFTAVTLSLLSTLALAEKSAEVTEAAPAVEVDTIRIQFEILDADQNGEITAEEAAASEELAGKFAGLDANNNGKLDGAEFSQFYTAEEK